MNRVVWIDINGIIICAIICCLITKADAQCSQDINGVYRFGQGCGFLCHCLNSEQCDANTGECASGCAFDWTGPRCQHKNIAIEGTSRHLDNIASNLFAPRANDRNLSTCSYTAEETAYTTRTKNPWWRIWLPYTFTLRKIDILTIDSHRKYFSGFKVIVESVPEAKHSDSDYYPDQSQICYTHGGTSLDSISMTVACDRVYSGNQVRIELANKRAQLVLCDVRIYGDCAENVCGYDCNKLCHCKDITASDKVSGTCSNGCTGRWSGSNGTCDTECANDMWGETCDIECGYCRFAAPCDVVTGKCPSRCEDGYKDTEQCTIECDDGNYGLECQSNCSENCKNNAPCNKTDGHCSNGCGPGFTGEKCSNRCPEGFYGNDCKDECSDNCNGGKSFCSNVDGICSNGCKSGYKGNLCNQDCDGTEWGMNCNKTCGKCKIGERCDLHNGSCSNGCKPGYKPTLICNEECDEGTYGVNCEGKCSINCLEVNKCSLTDGTCDQCRAGWQGERCDIACQNGTFGEDCSRYCGSCKTGSECNKTTGVCHEGCSEGFTGNMCTEEKEEIRPPPAKASPVAGISGGISGAVVLALLAVGVVLFLKRRQRQKKPFTNDNGEFSPDLIASDTNAAPKKKNSDRNNIYINATGLQKLNETQNGSQGLTDHKVTEEENENGAVYYNTRLDHEVLLSELESYVKTGLANYDYFVKQFQQIPYGMQYPTDVATKAQNHGKNRYKSMYAYDHSRVMLKTLPNQPDTDYINATYIMGYFGENAYIAAQGPIANTLGDFWRLVWEQHVTTIVMATNLSEEGKILDDVIHRFNYNRQTFHAYYAMRTYYFLEVDRDESEMKCIQYWAEVGGSVQHGNITVVTESEDIFAEFTVRRLTVSQQGTPGKQRTVTQFHYTAWPDKDVPKSTSSLLHFWYQVRRHDGKKTRPWLVHCSAGVGRTGTFIALDIQYDQGTDKGSVDVFECVDELRKQRVNMVQTKDQYKYLHSIIVEALVLPSQPIHTNKFHSVYNDLKEIDPKSGKTKLLLQYETLMFESGTTSGKNSEDDIYISAKRADNKQKNRYDNILAPNDFRPFLLTQVPGCSDYINGVFIPGYRDNFGYILTQTPLKSTAIDCCRLVYEQEVKVIVTFQENSDDDIGIYLPEKGSVKLGPFTVTFVVEEDKANYMRRDYQLLFQSEKRSVTQLIFKQWPTSNLTPPAPDEMLQFLEELGKLQRQNENRPILAQCLNGAERSGLVVVLMNIFERLRFDQEVSIPLVIRQLKIRRQQIIPNFEQFKFCHDVVHSYIESDSTYANM